MASSLSRQRAAQAWCTSETEKIAMIPELAEAFAEIIDEIWSKPWLGNATNKELLDELSTRIEVLGPGLDYSTTNPNRGREVTLVSPALTITNPGYGPKPGDASG